MKEINILIVDDENINRTILIKALSEIKNIKVYEAENGKQALDIISKKDISLILLDIIMPVMDGFEFLENLKKSSNLKSIPIIVISALDDYQSIYKALKMGCWDYFTKPLLKDVVSKILPIKVKNILSYKNAMDQIKNINEYLEKKIKASTQKLIHSDRLISMGILTGEIVHEINTPITYLKGNTGLLNTLLELFFKTLEQNYNNIEGLKIKDIEYKVFKQRILKLIESSQIGIEKIISIIETFRNFVKKDTSKYKDLDLNHIIDKSLEITKNFTQNRIKIIKKFDRIPLIRGNPQKIEQVFTNLIINASQSMDGNGTIIIETYYKDKYIYFKITDTGIGIEKDKLDKIFDLFYTTKEAGTGLGLFIIKEILKELKGEIKVESEVGKGTTFILKFPINK